MNLLVEIQKCNNIYNNLSNHVNKTKIMNTEIINGILVKYKNIKWLTGIITNIDGVFINKSMEVQIFLEDDYYIYNIKYIKSLLDENISEELLKTEEINETLFFDNHLNLFFIKL